MNDLVNDLLELRAERVKQLEEKYPDIDANRFMDLVEAFLRGYDKGIGIMHNIFYPDFKVCVFDEDGIGEYKCKKC